MRSELHTARAAVLIASTFSAAACGGGATANPSDGSGTNGTSSPFGASGAAGTAGAIGSSGAPGDVNGWGTGGASTFGTGGFPVTGAGGFPVTGAGGGVVGAGGDNIGAGGGFGAGGGSVGAGGGVIGAGGGVIGAGGGVIGAGGGSIGAGGGSAGAGGGTGTCCSDGNCLCHGDPPAAPTSKNGPYKTASFTMTTGTVYYPTDAEPPLAAVSICPGFLNTGPEMGPWGPFYASWGIVCVVTNTGAADPPNTRGTELVNAIKELKTQNTTSSSPLNGKLAGRYGTSGYSMGGGGTTFASEADPTLMTSVGLAAWGPDGPTVKTPTLFICSDQDTVASCTGTDSSYAAIPSPTPKMILDLPNVSHFNWFSPTDAATQGLSGAYALAFQKVFLEGDTRWKPILMTKPTVGTVQMTNIQ